MYSSKDLIVILQANNNAFEKQFRSEYVLTETFQTADL